MAKDTKLVDPEVLIRDVEQLKLRIESLEKNTLPHLRNVATNTENLVSTFHTMNERIESLELDVKTIRPDSIPLPQEIREGVSPAQVYLTALQSSLTAFIISNPSGMSLSQNKTAYASRTLAIDSALALAEATVDRLRARIANESPKP